MSELALKFISGRYQGAEYPLPSSGELLIGRSEDVDIVLAENMVSRKHAKIVAENNRMVLTDLGSTNGTYVNGERIRRQDLKLRDRVLVGTSILKVIRNSELTISQEVAESPAKIKALMEEISSNNADHSITMSGNLSEVPLPDLLQLFVTNKRSGILTISGETCGHVYLQNGQIQHAGLDDLPSAPAVKALCRMMTWSSGDFELKDHEPEHTIPIPGLGSESTEALLMEGVRQADEVTALEQDLPDLDGTPSLCRPMTPKLSKLAPEELDVLQLALNCSNLGETVDCSPLTDHQVYTHLLKLLKAGYLELD